MGEYSVPCSKTCKISEYSRNYSSWVNTQYLVVRLAATGEEPATIRGVECNYLIL